MKLGATLTLAVLLAVLIGCSAGGGDLWFDGTLDAAVERAQELDTPVFVEFYTDWCSWCRRLESEALTDRQVRSQLDQLVAVRLDAEGDGRAEAREFNIESYPTMVFLAPDGEELERIVGYLPPDKLHDEIARITSGDTFFACLQALKKDPANSDAVRRAVAGLLERSDPEGAIAKIRLFHSAEGHDHVLCQQLMFQAGRDLHYRVYLRAAKLYREGWPATLDVPPIPGSEHLRQLLDDGLVSMDPADQAQRLREARYEDAQQLLDLVSLDDAPAEDLFELAAFAFRGGHYDLAADLYGRWFASPELSHDAELLNRAAWQLYLARESIDTGVAMAREAYEANPSADVADTLARLLYVSGATQEAIDLQQRAAERATGPRAEQYLDVVGTMERGEEMTDEPAFETFPGPREISL